MGNVEPDSSPVHTSLTYLNFGEGARDSEHLKEKMLLFLSAKEVKLQNAI